MTMLLIFIGVASFLLSCLSFFRILRGGKKVGLIYGWAFLFGAFVWEDLLIFGILHFLAVVFVYLVRDLRWGLLFFSLFWIVRNFGEVIYWLLQQFSQPTGYPHDQYSDFRILRKVLGNITDQQIFILGQVLHQSLLIVFLMFLVWLLQNWSTIQVWF